MEGAPLHPKNRVVAVRQQLAALVGQADVASRPLAGSPEQPLPEIERDAALGGLIDGSPQIRAARAEVAPTEALTALARRQTCTDLFLRGGAAYNRELGEDTRGLTHSDFERVLDALDPFGAFRNRRRP